MIKQLDEDLFLDMLSMPRGTQELQDEFAEKFLLKYNPAKDDYGNLYVSIEDNEKTDVAFMSHIDTVHSKSCTFVPVDAGEGFAKVNPEAGLIENANCLGADCTTGVWVMINMIENNIPGLYCFFRDEEVGCLGSTWAAKNLDWSQFNHAISFDRYGTTSVITHQCSTQTASYEFTDELIKRFDNAGLPYQRDDGGVFTDSYSFVGVIPNCTNLSVGYYNQHSNQESQDLNFLIDLIDVCCMVDWSGLPVGEIEYTDINYDDGYDYYAGDTQYSFEVLYELEALLWENPEVEYKLQDIIKEYAPQDINDPFHVG